MNSSKLRSSLERLRLLLNIGRRPQSRLEQARLRFDRFLLSFAQADPVLDPRAVPPIVVAAVGGSGTRVLVKVLRKAGWFMGNRVDSRNEDSLPIAWFLTKWLRSLKDFPNVDSRTLALARRDFERMLNVHRRGIPSPDAPWGWKNPRSMWLIPFLSDRCIGFSALIGGGIPLRRNCSYGGWATNEQWSSGNNILEIAITCFAMKTSARNRLKR